MFAKREKPEISSIKPDFSHATGFTLIELMIVVSIIAIILTVALPVYSTYTIRAKVGEALGVAAAAKTSTTDACQAEPTLPALTNNLAGYSFGGSPYVESILVSGPCSAPVITIRTTNTGANPDPVLTLIGDQTGSGNFSWTCVSSNNVIVPSTCRS